MHFHCSTKYQLVTIRYTVLTYAINCINIYKSTFTKDKNSSLEQGGYFLQCLVELGGGGGCGRICRASDRIIPMCINKRVRNNNALFHVESTPSI